MISWKSSDEFFIASYTGLGGYQSGDYLIPHPRESAEELQRRKDLAIFSSYTKKVVDSILGYLFATTPSRDTDDSNYSRFILNADGKGSSLDEVIKRAFKLAMLVGSVYLLIDKDSDSNVAVSRLTDKLPYIIIKLPSSISNTSRDRLGNLQSITFSESQDDDIIYRHFDNQSWKLTKDKDGMNIINAGKHSLGVLPVIPLHSSTPLMDEIAVPSWIQDIALCNLDLYNAVSELRTQYRSQIFSILMLPKRFNDDSRASSEIVIGSSNALAYSPENGAPSYLEAPTSAITLLEGHVDKIIEKIYALACLEFVGGSNISGVALSYYFKSTNSMLVNMISNIEDTEIKVASLVSNWMSTDWNGTIKYNRKFDLKDTQAELTASLDALTADISPTANKELRRKIAHDILGGSIDSDIMQVIDNELDADSRNIDLIQDLRPLE